MAQLSEEWLLPHDLRVCQNLVDQVHATGGRRSQDLTRQGGSQVELDAGRELVEQGLHECGRLPLLD